MKALIVFLLIQTVNSHLNLLTATILELHNALNSYEITSRQLVELYLKRIDDVNHKGPELNAVIEINPDALEIAEQLDKERIKFNDKSRSLLHGIPILVKDNIATYDKLNTTCGSHALLGSKVPRDATVIDRLKRAGAIILGKTNLSEWANFRSFNVTRDGWSARGGITRSAYIKDGSTYGSSSGSAVAASIGLCAVALGTETDGSIISPSSINNVVGLKPTVGLTSRSGVIPISHNQDSIGPIARTVMDAAILLETIQGMDQRDEATLNKNAVRHCNYIQFCRGINGFHGLSLGVVRNLNYTAIPVDQLRTFNEAIHLMAKLGVKIIDPLNFESEDKLINPLNELLILEIDFKHDIELYLRELNNTNMRTLNDLIKFNDENPDKEFSQYTPDQGIWLESQNSTIIPDSPLYRQILNTNLNLSRDGGIDYLLDKHHLDALVMLSDASTTPSAMAGYPIISVPLGYLTDEVPENVVGRPYGIAFTGRAWSENILLTFADAFEKATNVRKRVIPVYAPV